MSEAQETPSNPTPEPPAGKKAKKSKWIAGMVGALGKKKDPAPDAAQAPAVSEPTPTPVVTAEVAATPPPVEPAAAPEEPQKEKRGWLGGWMPGAAKESPAETPAPAPAVAVEASATPPPVEPAAAPAVTVEAAATPPSPEPVAALALAPAAPAEAIVTATTTPSPTADDAAAGIIADARAFWKFLRRVLIIGFVVSIVFVVAEVSNIGRLFYAIHPVLGTAFFLLILGAVGAAVGRSVYRYVSTPQALNPPLMPQKPEEVTLAHLTAQVAFIDRYLRNCEANAELAGQRAEIQTARTRVAALTQRIAQPGFAAVGEAREEARALTDQEVPKILASLDARVEELIWREALAVGIGTAVSPNGMLDAFIVLWRNLNLISRVSRLYFGRPGLAGTLVIARDVAGSILVASYLESVAEAAGSLLGAQLGSLAGSVAGPVMEGMTNALVTVRVGCLAKDRCRAFQRWDQATKQGALKAVGAYTKKISGKLWKEILAASGLGLGKIGEKLKGGIVASGAAAKSGLAATGRAMGRLFHRKKKDGSEEEVEVEVEGDPGDEDPATEGAAPA